MKLVFKSTLVAIGLAAGLAVTSTAFDQQPTRAAEFSAMPSVGKGLKSSSDAFFNEARQSLPDDFYTLYRIVERLARANGLDERPWRVRISNAYEVNAYASELNALTFMAGILDQLHGDNAALACVVGHEMAHHTQDHIPTMVEVEAILQELLAEAEAEAVAEIQAAQQQQATNQAVGSLFGRVLGTVVGGNTGAVVGGTTASVLSSLSTAERQEAEARAAQIYEQKIAALTGEYSAILQGHEYESDEYGFKYMVRAGFDPQGCLRVMDVLSQNEHSRLPSFSHPSPSERIQKLNALNTQATVNTLLAEGQTNLSRTPQPLGYALSRDGVSLRVESRYGSSGSGFPE
jgi:predicted Zn-dependent protease